MCIPFPVIVKWFQNMTFWTSKHNLLPFKTWPFGPQNMTFWISLDMLLKISEIILQLNMNACRSEIWNLTFWDIIELWKVSILMLFDVSPYTANYQYFAVKHLWKKTSFSLWWKEEYCKLIFRYWVKGTIIYLIIAAEYSK